MKNNKFSKLNVRDDLDYRRDRMIQEVPLERRVNMSNCNCCGESKYAEQMIEYRYHDDKFKFCSDQCFAYYCGEIMFD